MYKSLGGEKESPKYTDFLDLVWGTDVVGTCGMVQCPLTFLIMDQVPWTLNQVDALFGTKLCV